MLPPSTESASTGVPPPHPPRVDPDEKICYNCETRSTPLWRLSREDGQWRCNACGIYLKHKHMERPLSLATNSERAARSAAAAQARRTAASPRLPRPDNASGAQASGWDSDDDGSSSGTEPLRKSTRVRKPVCRDLSPSPPRWRGGRIERDDDWMGDHQPVFVPPYWTKGSPQSVEDLQSSLIDLLLRQQVDALTDSQAALVLMRLQMQSHGLVTETAMRGPWRRHAMMQSGDGDSDYGMDFTALKRPPLSTMLPPPHAPLDTVKAPPKRACRRPDRPPMQCANCGVLDTPLWRKASDGSGATLCNACGIYLKTHNVHRPVHTMSASRAVVTSSPRPTAPCTPHKRKAIKPAAPAPQSDEEEGSDEDGASQVDGRPPATPLQVPQPRASWSPGSQEPPPTSSSPAGGHPLDSLAPPLRAAALTQLLPFIMHGVPAAAATAAAAATGGTNSPSGLATQCPSPRYTAPVIPPAGH